MTDGRVLANPLAAAPQAPAYAPQRANVAGPTKLRDIERALIARTLEEVGWVVGGPKGAAAKLGLQRTTLIHKMKKLQISRPLQSDGRLKLSSAEVWA
jgi:transcriptional regulator with GAF, ATPase, and Fis domain